MALFINVAALNAGGRVDPQRVVKLADDQLKSMEKYGNNCWPLENEEDNRSSKSDD
jgi:hypothetical protein